MAMLDVDVVGYVVLGRWTWRVVLVRGEAMQAPLLSVIDVLGRLCQAVQGKGKDASACE